MENKKSVIFNMKDKDFNRFKKAQVGLVIKS